MQVFKLWFWLVFIFSGTCPEDAPLMINALKTVCNVIWRGMCLTFMEAVSNVSLVFYCHSLSQVFFIYLFISDSSSEPWGCTNFCSKDAFVSFRSVTAGRVRSTRWRWVTWWNSTCRGTSISGSTAAKWTTRTRKSETPPPCTAPRDWTSGPLC